MKTLHLQVYGRVQGVGFRYACRREAGSLGLTGWVRNLRDGCVEIVAEGPSAALDAFSVWCGHGPPCAKVERVVDMPGPALGGYRTFEIKNGWDG